MYFKIMETISDRIKDLLKKHGVSQKDAAAGIESTPQTMSYNLGQAEPPLDFVRKICEYLKEPLYKAILSADEIDALQGISPDIAPIVEELSRVMSERKQSERDLILSGLMGFLRGV